MLVTLSNYNMNRLNSSQNKNYCSIKNKCLQDVFVRKNQLNFKGNPKISLFEDVVKIIRQGDFETIGKLADPHAMNAKLQSFLHIAAEEKQLEVAKALLLRGLEVNQKDNMGRTPFAIACRKQDESLLDLFLGYSPDVNTKDALGDTPLHHAIPNQRLLGILLGRRANPYTKNDFGLPVLHSAAEDLETVDYLLKKGVNPNSINNEEQTLLHTAAIEGNTNLADKLLGHDAEINFRDKDGKTPLFYAKDHEMLKWLLEKGASVDILDNEGRTVLHEFTLKNDLKSIIELLNRDADPNCLDSSNKSPILYANNNAIRRRLLEAGANPNVRTSTGGTLLHIATQKGNEEVMRTLFEYHADPNILDQESRTPLSYASNNKIRRLLLENGAVPNEKPYLHFALKTNNDEFFEDLLNADIDVNLEDSHGRTPIFYCRTPEDVFKLVKKGAFVDYQDNKGNTPLHYYSATGNNGLIEALRKSGANEDSTNIKDELPQNLAEQFRKYGCWIK